MAHRIFISAIFFILVAQPHQSWAADMFVGLGGEQGVSYPAGKQVLGMFVSVDVSLSERLYVDGGVVFKTHLLSGDNVHRFGGEWGLSFGNNVYCRVFTTPAVMWDGKWTTFGDRVVVINRFQKKFEVGCGLEIGGIMRFKGVPGQQRLSIRLDYLPDTFDRQVGGKGGDIVVSGRFGFWFPTKKPDPNENE